MGIIFPPGYKLKYNQKTDRLANSISGEMSQEMILDGPKGSE